MTTFPTSYKVRDIQGELIHFSSYEEMEQRVLSPDNLFLNAAMSGKNCFLTGVAGTGKSTLLRKLIAQNPDIDVTAPTGIAAINVGGMTLHRFCGMMLGPAEDESDEHCMTRLLDSPPPSRTRAFKRVQQCKTLVIDEISMLPGRILDFVDYLFREVRLTDEPFGGIQLIAIGDFMQLPPVRTQEDKPYDWAFLSEAWAEAKLTPFVLEKVWRQEDPHFIAALNSFRSGNLRGDLAKMLMSRVRSNIPSDVPRLYTHNTQVDKWNELQLSELEGELVSICAQTSGHEQQVDFLKRNLVTPHDLNLKLNALVMLTINKPASMDTENFVNGDIGEVAQISPDVIDVRIPDGRLIKVTKFTWGSKETARPGDDAPKSATFTQFPHRLAWALTIHKSQGLTMDRAHVDIRAAREPGQAYVAVSRVRSLAGLTFKDWFKGIHTSAEAHAFHANLRKTA